MSEHIDSSHIQRIEEKLAHMERTMQQLEQATLDQELRLERLQSAVSARPRPAQKERFVASDIFNSSRH